MDQPLNRPFAGCRALITGATRRLGRAIAERLGNDGARLALSFRSDREGRERTQAHLDDLGIENHWFEADLGRPEDCRALTDGAVDALGGLDILVNNAAMFRKTPVETLTLEDFDEQMAVNARSVYLLSAQAGTHMRDQGGGAIVNIADISAERPWGTHIPYCASKAAVVNMTRGFAKALAPDIRVNAVSPGAALSPEDAAQGSGTGAAKTPGVISGESGAEAIAAAVALLLRATYMTGVVLGVDGGRSIS